MGIISLCLLPAVAYSQTQSASESVPKSDLGIEATFTSEEYLKKVWSLQGKNDIDQALAMIAECISFYEDLAMNQAGSLNALPPKEEIDKYKVMNDVATCYFVKGEILRDKAALAFEAEEVTALQNEAIATLTEMIGKYPYAQQFDPRGWYWSLSEKAEKIIEEIKQGDACEATDNPIAETTKIVLSDNGTEFPVDYEKYGTFENAGTAEYRYIPSDFAGLRTAVGEGIYPNSASLRDDPAYQALRKELPKVDHWEVLNSRDLHTAFYKWNVAPEPQAVKQFYIADILERAGLVEQAVKSLYSVMVHFPKSYGWTYWHTPWYPAKVSMYRIKFILKNNPQLHLRLEGASVVVENGYDNDISNDVYIVNPGRLIKIDPKEGNSSQGVRELKNVVKTVGTGKVKLIQYEGGDWQMTLDSKPFMVHGITYSPTRIGESPDKNTLVDWTIQDLNKNGLIDGPYEAWADNNKNNLQDSDEPTVGDFQLLKEMGVNCLRLYHQPHKHDKKLLNEMAQKYGIYVAMGDFLGKYTMGSEADWATGTDYDDPAHCENMLKSVESMVNEYKDEPAIIMWILGNENVYGLGCNADKKPESFFSFANKAAKLIKSLDPMQRPVLIVSGDILFLDVFAAQCPDIDIFGANLYRGRHGFLDFWDEVRGIAQKPAMVTEYGMPAYGDGYTLEEAEEYQAQYHRTAWTDIDDNSAGKGAGNSIGAFLFEWMDEWWKAYNPKCHDATKLSAGPFLDGYYREEWFGIVSQGDGSHSPFMRQLRKAYFTYKDLWNKD